MVWYAYAKNSKTDDNWRYLIIAPNFKILDQFYEEARKIVGVNTFWRVSDDFYVYDRSEFDLGKCTTQKKQLEQFKNKLIFTLLNDLGGRVVPTFNNGSIHGGATD
ncbi:uncharacterized protein G6M90_00g017730 [Metarhizium brunneum]|uniref:Uncharacterized protein n=1 Tax=Metarhizium brunneum TaxID=500148 RepID=A0A7D5UR60_9HYPO|nr:hypothetical protein G6M90_00g017730 [Metarhizium brunneum]